MAAYLIADIDVHDPIQFASYREAVAPMIARFGGRYLMRGPALELREGEDFLNRLVVLEFPTMQALRAFYDSPDYAPLIAMRQACTTSRVSLAEGYQPVGGLRGS